MGLVEVAGVAHDSRHPVLDVFQHQVVLWLGHSQRRANVAEDKIVVQNSFSCLLYCILQTAVCVRAASRSKVSC